MKRLARVAGLIAFALPTTLLAQPPARPLGPAPAPRADSESTRPEAPPIPEPPLDVAPLPTPVPPVEPIPVPPVEPIPAAGVRLPDRAPTPAIVDDPFQQTPRDRVGDTGELSRASAAFAAKRFAQAAGLFAEADKRREPFSVTQREEWGYCRLHEVAVQLNAGKEPPDDYATLRRDVESALQIGSARLRPFGTQLLAEIQRRGPAAAGSSVQGGWQAIETGSFRILYKGPAAQASEVAQTAEAARRDMYERWAGPAGGNWSPRCDIYLHPSAADYMKATGKPADQPGHSTVGIQAGRVVSRRIDLHADEPDFLDAVLPSEVTQVVLADLFADQAIPRWALVGMAALSESPESVARYHRAVPSLLREKKLFAVGPFLDRPDFPDPASVTPFYAESVSLVSFLVAQKGPKAFAAFLREAPRRGIARALTTHYGFKDAADLQDRWVKHELGGE